MALPAAIALGIAAAIGVPLAVGDMAARHGDALAMMHYRVGTVTFPCSWTIFIVVTVCAWGLIGWARRG